MAQDNVFGFGDFMRGMFTIMRKFPALRKVGKMLGKATGETPGSLGASLAVAASRWGAYPALKSETTTMSYGELHSRSNQLANRLIGDGVAPGDTVAVLMENRVELLVVVAAIAKAGAVASMVNTNQRRRALIHSLGCATPQRYVVGAELVEAFEEVRPELGELAHDAVLGVPDGELGLPQGLRDLFAESAEASVKDPAPMAKLTLGDPVFYVFTSGTTGLPKASIMEHKRWVGAGTMFGIGCLDLKPKQTIYAPLPLYHNQALTMAWSSAVATGSALAIRRKLTVSGFWEDCARHDAVAVAYIGEIPRYLLNQPPSPADRQHPVRKLVGVGMRPDIWMPFKKRFGIRDIYEYYGASELNAGFFNLMSLDRTVGFCPMPWALVDFDVADGAPRRGADGWMKKLGKGDTGLLITKVTERYKFEGYTDKEASEKKLFRDVFEAGDVWVNTGDLMFHMGYGHLQFVDRVGDTFRWKSENVSTSEVEAVAHAVETVAEATVYGVEIPGTAGRAGMVTVVAAGTLDLDNLYETLREELPSYAVPRFVRVTDSLLTTGTFKHRKVALREQAFDPSVSDEPVYVLLPKAKAYTRVDGELYAAIMAGEYAF